MTRWLNPTLLTCDHVGICFSEQDFYRELRRMKVPQHNWGSWLTEGALATTHHLTSGKGNRASIVCIPVRPEEEGVAMATLLVHEAVHVVQEYFEWIGEAQVGKETQAYAIQNISAQLMRAYRDELFKQLKKDEKEWTTSLTSKPTGLASPSPPSTQTATTLPYLSALPEGMTLTSYLIGSTNGAETKTD